MTKVILIIRIAIGLALVYAIYTETGMYTALFAFLVLIGTEANDYAIKKIVETIKEMNHDRRNESQRV